MKTIKICDQPKLGFLRTFQITLEGLRYRVFRAAVALSVIAVAVAFLMNIVSESVIKQAVGRSVAGELDDRRLILRWAARISAAPDTESLIRDLAAMTPGDQGWVEMRRIGGMRDDELESLRRVSCEADRYLRFFESIGYDRRRRLVYTAAGTEVFEWLAVPEKFAEFEQQLATMKSVRFNTPLATFRSFLDGWSGFASRLDNYTGKHAEVVRLISAGLGSTSVFAAFAERNPVFIKLLEESGFELDDAMVASLSSQAADLLNTKGVELSMENKSICQMVAQNANAMPSEVTIRDLWRMLKSKRAAEAYLARAQAVGLDTGKLDADGLVRLASDQKRSAALEKAAKLTADAGGGWLGIGERMSWLLVVSMLVCAIGISNAMLMAVTERFREIATMKCLGALDEFIMLVFVLEACCLGLVGGIIGAMLGNVIGMTRMTCQFGAWIVQVMPWEALMLWAVGSVGIGIVLAAVSAVYPSFKAARLAPMEAMRIE